MELLARFAPCAGLLVVMAACSSDPAAEPATSQPASAITETTVESSATTTTVVETTTTSLDLGYRWEVGDCFRFGTSDDLPYEPFGTELLAPCEEGHTHEVYFTGTFPGGEGAAFPGDSINLDIAEICIGAFVEYLGALPVEVRFDLVMYLPDAEEWASGLRYQGCVVFLPDGVNTFRELVGSAEGRGPEQLLEIDPGSCLAGASVKVPPVGCDQIHVAEVIGTVSHPAQLGAPYPDAEQLELFAVSECNTLGADYVVPSSTTPVVAFARAFSEVEWDAGWREFHCLAVAVAPTGEVLTVRGSFAEEGWEVVRGDVQT